VDEPRHGIRRGRFPGSRNLYYRDLFNPEDGTLLSNKKIAGIFHKHGIDTFSTTAVMSGSGISAAVLELALQCLGNEKVSLYVGSWAHYARVEEPQLNTGYWNTPSKQSNRYSLY
jgi:thiosulfate/3-mercaptopyruvate sulfurtransferase